MTTTDLAAALLRGVKPVCTYENMDPPRQTVWLDDVLTALSRALDPALAERAGEVLEWLSHVDNDNHTRFQGKTTSEHAADLITALLAQNAALRAEVRKSAMDAVSAGCQAQEAWEAQKAAEAVAKKLRAERDDALTFLDNAVSKAPEPLKALGKYLAGRLDEDEWPTAEQYLNAAAKACADRAEAAEAQIAALTARVEGLTGALGHIESMTVHSGGEIHGVTAQHWRSAFEGVQEAARAALSTTEASHE